MDYLEMKSNVDSVLSFIKDFEEDVRVGWIWDRSEDDKQDLQTAWEELLRLHKKLDNDFTSDDLQDLFYFVDNQVASLHCLDNTWFYLEKWHG